MGDILPREAFVYLASGYVTPVPADPGGPAEPIPDVLLRHDAALRAEVERLRAALERIERIENKLDGGDWDEIEEARRIAHTALEAKTL